MWLRKAPHKVKTAEDAEDEEESWSPPHFLRRKGPFLGLAGC